MGGLAQSAREWETVGPDAGPTTIVRNRLTGDQYQCHALNFDNEDQYRRNKQEFRRRISMKDPFVAQLHRLDEEKPVGYCATQIPVKLYSERIKYRLKDTRDLPQEKGLKMLRDAAVGYQSIKNSHPSGIGFTVNDSMVGVNAAGDIRVWFNQLFYENKPSQPMPASADDEPAFVEQLTRVFQPHISGGLPPGFVQRFVRYSDGDISLTNLVHFIDQQPLSKSNFLGVAFQPRQSTVRQQLRPPQSIWKQQAAVALPVRTASTVIKPQPVRYQPFTGSLFQPPAPQAVQAHWAVPRPAEVTPFRPVIAGSTNFQRLNSIQPQLTSTCTAEQHLINDLYRLQSMPMPRQYQPVQQPNLQLPIQQIQSPQMPPRQSYHFPLRQSYDMSLRQPFLRQTLPQAITKQSSQMPQQTPQQPLSQPAQQSRQQSLQTPLKPFVQPPTQTQGHQISQQPTMQLPHQLPLQRTLQPPIQPPMQKSTQQPLQPSSKPHPAQPIQQNLCTTQQPFYLTPLPSPSRQSLPLQPELNISKPIQRPNQLFPHQQSMVKPSPSARLVPIGVRQLPSSEKIRPSEVRRLQDGPVQTQLSELSPDSVQLSPSRILVSPVQFQLVSYKESRPGSRGRIYQLDKLEQDFDDLQVVQTTQYKVVQSQQTNCQSVHSLQQSENCQPENVAPTLESQHMAESQTVPVEVPSLHQSAAGGHTAQEEKTEVGQSQPNQQAQPALPAQSRETEPEVEAVQPQKPE